MHLVFLAPKLFHQRLFSGLLTTQGKQCKVSGNVMPLLYFIIVVFKAYKHLPQEHTEISSLRIEVCTTTNQIAQF